ncbi:hypothetical protein GF312_09510 [Candidatus Poribacteria bacterium]|nr:hypothetical protein [Candidatus Poribacteria bacterium]
MRQLIMTKGTHFDIDSIKPKLETIVDAFDQYLDEYRVKTSRTMHGLMGPIPMILDGAKTRKEDAETLIGKAVRAHEMNPGSGGYISPEAIKALEKAVNGLIELFNTIPLTVVNKVADRIRYNVYYVRRKKSIEWLEKTKEDFIKFLHNRYSSDAELTEAWKESITFEDVRFPSTKNKAYKQANEKKKQDIRDFHSHTNIEEFIDEEEEENE